MNIYPNPLIENRADPFIYKHTDRNYYFTSTSPEYDRIELRISKTILGLTTAKSILVWEKHDKGPMSQLIWAPEIHFLCDKWYIYFAAAETSEIHPIDNTFQHRMYVLESTSPTEKWIEKGEIKTNMNSFCLDATVFSHNELPGSKPRGIGLLPFSAPRGGVSNPIQPNETNYYIWAQKDPNIRGNSNIYISKMKNPWTLCGPQVMLSKPQFDWESSVIPVNEGAAVLKNNDKIFITYSANATGAEYCLGLLTSNSNSDLLNPSSWKKSPIPVFKTSHINKKFGPGHNSFTISEDGKENLIVYHVRDFQNISGDPLDNPERHTCVQSFSFDENGTPVFGEPNPLN